MTVVCGQNLCLTFFCYLCAASSGVVLVFVPYECSVFHTGRGRGRSRELDSNLADAVVLEACLLLPPPHWATSVVAASIAGTLFSNQAVVSRPQDFKNDGISESSSLPLLQCGRRYVEEEKKPLHWLSIWLPEGHSWRCCTEMVAKRRIEISTGHQAWTTKFYIIIFTNLYWLVFVK